MQQSTTTNEMSRDSIDNRSQVTDPEAAKLSRKRTPSRKKETSIAPSNACSFSSAVFIYLDCFYISYVYVVYHLATKFGRF